MKTRWFLVSLALFAFPSAPALAGKNHDSHSHDKSHSLGKSHSHDNPHAEDKGHAHHHDGDGHTGAHVHGEVALLLALEDNNLVVNLQSPAMNLVGFEQRASTPEQKQRVESAEASLRQVADWLKLDGGECRVTDVSTDFSGVLPASDPTTDAQHADVDVTAQLLCAQPDKLRGLSVTLLRDFPGVEKVTVQWALAAGAGERVLTAGNAKVTFSQ